MGISKLDVSKRNAILTLKLVIDKLQRSLSLSKRLSSSLSLGHQRRVIEVGREADVPKDVKEGHFAVLAVEDGRCKRFVVDLRYLNHPQFLRLLEQAAEEFGFNQEGAIAIPCRPSELEKILGEQWKEERDVNGGMEWRCMVESC